MPKSWKHHVKGKGKKRAGVAAVSMGDSIQLYLPMKLFFVQGYPFQGDGSRLGGHHCHPTLFSVYRSHAPPGGHTGHLQSHFGQLVCSAIRQYTGHRGW